MNLERFVEAQANGVFEAALTELQRGRKGGHWMWFIMPQLRGLGYSETAAYFGLDGVEEAAAYLSHPLLGPRLLIVAEAMRDWQHLGAEAVLGQVDALKFRSCLTLFAAVPGAPPLFFHLLAAYFAGQGCPATLAATT